ncbi:MAG: choice-of-anchor Q domain-containing protein, partial [Solirubrobacterales bacterium]
MAGVAEQDPTVDVSLSVLRDLQLAFVSQATASASATVGVGASDFEAARHAESGNGGTATFQQTHPNIDADPLFASELLGDFSLRTGSPAIDSTFSPPLAAGESATDLAGAPRVLDGNGDGVAAPDMGAFEAPALPDKTPPNTEITYGKKRKGKLRAGRHGFLLRVSFHSTETASTFECRVDVGEFAPCSSPFQKRLSAGLHRFEVRAVDAAGNVDPTPAKISFRVAGPLLRHQGKHHRHKRHRAN